MSEKEYLSIPQLARLLGLSRVAVYKKVKKGQIKAVRIGRNFAIHQKQLSQILGQSLSPARKKQIDQAVRRLIRDYSETLKLLGRE